MRMAPLRFPPRRMMIVGARATAALLVVALLLSPAQAAPPKEVSLLETLAEWKYPGSNLLGGASMSDGGNPIVQSIKCSATLTTPDPIEKVIKFYSAKLEAPAPPGEAKEADPKSVSTQDDSQGRPVTLRAIVVNKAETATTIVISWAEGEKETHIVWLHYIRLGDKR